MKVLFVRHGESQDDIENRYGGWADFELTEEGKSQITEKLGSIKKLGVGFEKVYTSPLLRAKASGKILAEGLSLPVDVMEYVKERNTYGLLSGMEKGEAKTKYPELVEAYENGEYVDGSERIEDLVARVKKSIKLIENCGQENVIVVTHGNYMKGLVEKIMGKKLVKKEDGGWVLMELKNGKFEIVSSNGIEIG